MLYYVSGKLISACAGIAVIDNAGIAYMMSVSDRTVGALMANCGEEARLFTYLHVKEDGIELFGFYDEEERNTFKMLIGVSGVGPKAALSILSALSPERLAMCVISDDAKSITAAQGVGLKSAQKIIIELKDKIAKGKGSIIVSREAMKASNNVQGTAQTEALGALEVLGYTRAQALSALSGVSGETVEELIKGALRALNN